MFLQYQLQRPLDFVNQGPHAPKRHCDLQKAYSKNKEQSYLLSGRDLDLYYQSRRQHDRIKIRDYAQRADQLCNPNLGNCGTAFVVMCRHPIGIVLPPESLSGQTCRAYDDEEYNCVDDNESNGCPNCPFKFPAICACYQTAIE